MDSKFCGLFDFEHISLKIEQLASVSLAIEDAMYYGSCAPETYFAALSFLSDSLFEYSKNMQEIVEKGFIQAREVGNNG